MTTLLLVVIYLSFISLGLPDSLLGSAWPVMRLDIGAELSWAGILSMIMAFATIISSLISDFLTRKLGTGLLTATSVLVTAASLFGFATVDNFYILCLICVPYGIGAGSVDAALNNYVALHFASRHMSWLHCFWGVGASISPYIMSYCIGQDKGWQGGYLSVSVLQIVLTAIIFLSLPLWKKRSAESDDTQAKNIGIKGALRIKGVKWILITFFCYCAMESTAGLWASSYLVSCRGVDAPTAARFASLFYLGITAGRFFCGFIAERLGDKRLILIGSAVLISGIVLIMLPHDNGVPALVGLVVVGLGCAPIYPSVIHSTPLCFGKENSQAIIGIQMASAYTGTTFMPPVFGLVAQYISAQVYPLFLMMFAVLMLVTYSFTVKSVSSAQRSSDT